MFQQALLEGDLEALDLDTVAGLATFMATVRRRIAAELEADGLSRLRHALALLLSEIKDTSSANQRIAAFCAQYPADRAHRWVRDLAAEVLHNVEPGTLPADDALGLGSAGQHRGLAGDVVCRRY